MSFAMVIALILLSFGITISFLRRSKALDIKVRERTKQLENSRTAARNVLQDLQVESEKLIQNKVKEEALLESIGDGMIAVDERGRIIAMSKVTEGMLGWRFDEIKNKNFCEVILIVEGKGKIIPKEKRPLHIALTTGKKTTTTTYFYTRKDGTIFPVALVVAPIILKGKIIGAIDSFRDVTKEKEIDKAKTEFVSLASHQLRTPLTSVKWYSEMLLEEDAGKLNKKQKRYAVAIYQGNERMIELVRNLLNVSRIEMGNLAVNLKLTDIGEILRKIVKEQAPFIKRKKHDVVVEISEGLPKIFTDPQLSLMIFQNLLGNAIKYTPTGGKITCIMEKKDKEIIIGIKDTGIGIPENQQNKIFQKLSRGDNAIRQYPGGTGLELYVTKAMVDALSGRIWFKSKENEGTTFWIALPIK